MTRGYGVSMNPPAGLEWTGDISNCDLCHQKINNAFVDGKTIYGPWGIMCIPCHIEKGCGLGIGKGQKYIKDKKTGRFVQVASNKNPPDDITSQDNTWTRYDLYTAPDGSIHGQASTNDNNDDGYPDFDVSVWSISYKNYNEMLERTGGSHDSYYGQPVEVFLDGKRIPQKPRKNPPLLSRKIFDKLLVEIFISTTTGMKIGAPEGHLYAPLMGDLDLDSFNRMIDLAVRNGLVTKSGHLLKATKKLIDVLKD